MTRREVTLFGRILPSRQGGGHFVLDIDARLGDAAEFGIRGQITLLDRQCFTVESGLANLPDVVRIPAHIAQLKGELAGNVRQRKRR